MSKTELFFENNGKKITVVIFALFLLATAILGFKTLVVDPTEARAAEAIYKSQMLFEGATPDYRVALEGDGSSEGFLSVAENYGSTTTGNLANHYAGICYMKLGDYDSALKYLKAYKKSSGTPAQIINAQNIGLQGDIAVNQSRYSDAVKLFKEAASISENPLTTPLYLCKAGVAAIAAGDSAEAEVLLTRVVELYPTSSDARNAQRYLGTIE